MKKMILAATILGLAAAGIQTANAGVHFGFQIGIPVPVFYSPPPVYCAPAPPVVYAPRGYYAPPAPMVVYRTPDYYAQPRVVYGPAPAFGFRFGVGGHGHFRHDRW
jgi:hypothetical protein